MSNVLSKKNTVESPGIPYYDLIGVKGNIQTIQKVVILTFTKITIKGATKLMTHSKHMIVIGKPIEGYLDHVAVARSYDVLRPRVGKVDVCL